MAHVRMTNPKTGGTWDCPADYVKRAEALGFKREGQQVESKAATTKSTASPRRRTKAATKTKKK